MVKLENSMESSVDLAVWICNACDSNVISFAEQAFYTCERDCDCFICASCAECPKGHTLKKSKEIIDEDGEGNLFCNKCNDLKEFEDF